MATTHLPHHVPAPPTTVAVTPPRPFLSPGQPQQLQQQQQPHSRQYAQQQQRSSLYDPSHQRQQQEYQHSSALGALSPTPTMLRAAVSSSALSATSITSVSMSTSMMTVGSSDSAVVLPQAVPLTTSASTGSLKSLSSSSVSTWMAATAHSKQVEEQHNNEGYPSLCDLQPSHQQYSSSYAAYLQQQQQSSLLSPSYSHAISEAASRQADHPGCMVLDNTGTVRSGPGVREYAVRRGLCPLCAISKTHQRRKKRHLLTLRNHNANELDSSSNNKHNVLSSIFFSLQPRPEWEPMTTVDMDGNYTVYKGYCLQPTCYTLRRAQELLGERPSPARTKVSPASAHKRKKKKASALPRTTTTPQSTQGSRTSRSGGSLKEEHLQDEEYEEGAEDYGEDPTEPVSEVVSEMALSLPPSPALHKQQVRREKGREASLLAQEDDDDSTDPTAWSEDPWGVLQRHQNPLSSSSAATLRLDRKKTQHLMSVPSLVVDDDDVDDYLDRKSIASTSSDVTTTPCSRSDRNHLLAAFHMSMPLLEVMDPLLFEEDASSEADLFHHRRRARRAMSLSNLTASSSEHADRVSTADETIDCRESTTTHNSSNSSELDRFDSKFKKIIASNCDVVRSRHNSSKFRLRLPLSQQQQEADVAKNDNRNHGSNFLSLSPFRVTAAGPVRLTSKILASSHRWVSNSRCEPTINSSMSSSQRAVKKRASFVTTTTPTPRAMAALSDDLSSRDHSSSKSHSANSETVFQSDFVPTMFAKLRKAILLPSPVIPILPGVKDDFMERGGDTGAKNGNDPELAVLASFVQNDDWPTTIWNLIHRHHANVPLVREGLVTLMTCAGTSQTFAQSIFATSHSVKTILAVMDEYADDDDMIGYCCGLLECWSQNTPRVDVLCVNKSRGDRHHHPPSPATAALVELEDASSFVDQESSLLKQLLDQMVLLIHRQGSNVENWSLVLCTLYYLTVRHPSDCQEAIINTLADAEPGTMNCLVRNWHESYSIMALPTQEALVFFLWQLTTRRTDAVSQLLSHDPILPILVEVVSKVHSTVLHEAFLGLMSAMFSSSSTCHYDVLLRHVPLTVFKAMIESLTRYPQEAGIQTQGLSALQHAIEFVNVSWQRNLLTTEDVDLVLGFLVQMMNDENSSTDHLALGCRILMLLTDLKMERDDFATRSSSHPELEEQECEPTGEKIVVTPMSALTVVRAFRKIAGAVTAEPNYAVNELDMLSIVVAMERFALLNPSLMAQQQDCLLLLDLDQLAQHETQPNVLASLFRTALQLIPAYARLPKTSNHEQAAVQDKADYEECSQEGAHAIPLLGCLLDRLVEVEQDADQLVCCLELLGRFYFQDPVEEKLGKVQVMVKAYAPGSIALSTHTQQELDALARIMQQYANHGLVQEACFESLLNLLVPLCGLSNVDDAVVDAASRVLKCVLTAVPVKDCIEARLNLVWVLVVLVPNATLKQLVAGLVTDVKECLVRNDEDQFDMDDDLLGVACNIISILLSKGCSLELVQERNTLDVLCRALASPDSEVALQASKLLMLVLRSPAVDANTMMQQLQNPVTATMLKESIHLQQNVASTMSSAASDEIQRNLQAILTFLADDKANDLVANIVSTSGPVAPIAAPNRAVGVRGMVDLLQIMLEEQALVEASRAAETCSAMVGVLESIECEDLNGAATGNVLSKTLGQRVAQMLQQHPNNLELHLVALQVLQLLGAKDPSCGPDLLALSAQAITMSMQEHAGHGELLSRTCHYLQLISFDDATTRDSNTKGKAKCYQVMMEHDVVSRVMDVALNHPTSTRLVREALLTIHAFAQIPTIRNQFGALHVENDLLSVMIGHIEHPEILIAAFTVMKAMVPVSEAGDDPILPLPPMKSLMLSIVLEVLSKYLCNKAVLAPVTQLLDRYTYNAESLSLMQDKSSVLLPQLLSVCDVFPDSVLQQIAEGIMAKI